jgi:hypothetical protein
MGQGSPSEMGKQPGLPGDRKQGDEKKDKKYELSRAALPRTPVDGDGATAGGGGGVPSTGRGRGMRRWGGARGDGVIDARAGASWGHGASWGVDALEDLGTAGGVGAGSLERDCRRREGHGGWGRAWRWSHGVGCRCEVWGRGRTGGGRWIQSGVQGLWIRGCRKR